MLFWGGECVYPVPIVSALLMTLQRMHICEAHDEMLPETIDPMVMPDTEREVHLLLFCLSLKIYPSKMRLADTGSGAETVRHSTGGTNPSEKPREDGSELRSAGCFL